MLLCDELYKNWQIKPLVMTTVCDKLVYMCMHNINMPHAALNFNLINGSVAVDKGERVSSWVINYLLNNTPILSLFASLSWDCSGITIAFMTTLKKKHIIALFKMYTYNLPQLRTTVYLKSKSSWKKNNRHHAQEPKHECCN